MIAYSVRCEYVANDEATAQKIRDAIREVCLFLGVEVSQPAPVIAPGSVELPPLRPGGSIT